VTREVTFAPEALADLYKLYDDIALDGGAGRAQSYTDRIIAHCLGRVTFPERGTRRDDLRPGLRIADYDLSPPRHHRLSYHRHDRDDRPYAVWRPGPDGDIRYGR
jgi:plasmid stabilization system protein ParE